jgi:hypothetical protein
MAHSRHEVALLVQHFFELIDERLLVALLNLAHDLLAARLQAIEAAQHEAVAEQHLRRGMNSPVTT